MTFAQPFKDYEILERLGAGAMGTVFKARQKRLDRLVALKVLKPSLARNRNYVERLRREARIVASLNHPDIVAGYDIGEEGGYHFFVMEYVDAKSLATLLKEWGSFPEEQVLEVATRVASALDHAFKKGVIHRDIKPGNILIDAAGRAKLTDMGLAKAPEDAALTQEGATVGTPQYISPEQARDPSKADVRSDLYSLGATLFHMATGQPPFQGASLAKVIHDVIHTRPPSAVALNPALTDGLNLVIRKLMAKDPNLRYATPAELLADLQRVRRSEPPAVDEASLVEAEGEGVPQRRWGVLAAAIAVVAIVALSYAVWRPRDDGRPPPLDPTSVFATRLGTELAACDGYRARLRLLAQAAASAATDAERRAVADLKSGMLISWQEALVTLVRERRDHMGDWLLRDEHWRDPERVLRREVVDAVEARFQLARPELPAPLPQVLDAEVERLVADLEPRIAERDAGLVAAWAGHWERQVTPAWRAALDAQDYGGAARALQDAVVEFFGREGRPRREVLADVLRQRLDAVDAPLRAEAAVMIEQAEAAAADDLVRVTRQGLQQFAEQLRRGDDPRLVQLDHDRWRRELEARHPDATLFRAGRDPWRRVGDFESAFGTELEAALRRAERRRFAGNLQVAVAALLADGDARQEIGWLRAQVAEAQDVVALRDRAVAVLDGALRARDWLLAGLMQRTEGKPAAFSDPVALGRTLQISVRGEAGRFELIERDGARVRRVSLAAVRVSEVRERAQAATTPLDLPADVRRGLALWHYLANESRAAAGCLDPDADDLFRDHLVPAVQVALRQRLGDDVDARAALARLRDYRQLPTGALDEALSTFQGRFGASDLAAANAQFLDDVRSHLAAQRQRDAALSTLRAAVPAAFSVELSDAGEAVVVCDADGANDPPMGSGWRRAGARLEFVRDDVMLASLREHGLLVTDSLSTEQAVHVSFALAMPAQGSRPRVWLFEVHGVGVALGCAGDGSPVAVVVSGDELQKDAALQPRLEKELDGLVAARSLPRIVPGARHELEVYVRVQPQRLTARVVFDGVELATGSVPRPPRVAPRTAVLPMQPLSVFRIRVTGRP